jgi:hypothetical protein
MLFDTDVAEKVGKSARTFVPSNYFNTVTAGDLGPIRSSMEVNQLLKTKAILMS